MDDLISRRAAIDALEKIPVREFKKTDGLLDALVSVGQVYMALKQLPSAQQDCTECAEYDQTTKSCPKYCDVIQRTLEESQPKRKTGQWMATEADEPCFYRCSECGRLIDERENYCPNCGADMRGEGEK